MIRLVNGLESIYNKKVWLHFGKKIQHHIKNQKNYVN